MAIQAKFIADFTQFKAETEKARAELKGFETQAQSAAVAADRIGTSSSTATKGVGSLAAATTTLATSQDLAKLSTAELDAMIAGEVVALGTATTATTAAATASGAYGSVLFATAEAEVAATAATAGLATSLVAGATAVAGFVATLAPWLIAIGVAVELIKKYVYAQREAVKAEAEWLNQAEILTQASREAGHAITDLAEATKILEAAQRHQLLLNPALAAQNYIDKLTEQGRQALRTAAEEDALNEGLSARGIVLGTTTDFQKEWTKATEESEKASKASSKAIEEYNDWLRKLQRETFLTTYGFKTMGDAFKTLEVPPVLVDIERGLGSVYQDLTQIGTHIGIMNATVLPDFGIKLYDVGQTGVKSFGDLRTTAQRFEEEVGRIGRDLPLMIADALRGGDWERSIDQLGAMIGERLGFAIAGPLGAAIGSFLPQIGQGIADFFGSLLPGEGPFSDFRRQIEEAIKKAKEFKQTQDDALDLLKEASGKYGPSQPELEATEKHLHDLFDAMVKAGTYSADQLGKAYYAWQKALADAGNEAAKAWIKAHDEADKTSKAADTAMQKLLNRQEELTRSISQEAPEEVMGVIEQQMRAERDALEEQIKNAQTAADAEADAQSEAAEITKERWGDASQVLKDEMSTAGDEAASHIRDAFDFTIRIPIAFDVPSLPNFSGELPEPIPQASGGDWIVRKPTLFLAGEGGAERATFTPLVGRSSGTGEVINLRVPVMLDSRVLAEVHIDNLLKDEAGIRRATKRVAAG